jgi:uncharacterized membrane protein YidH (DUF202 family)
MPIMAFMRFGAASDSARAPPDEFDDQRFELERLLMEADRMMMTMVNLALSLIGFGFSINAFFNDTARAAARTDHEARMFGIMLVILGLLFLCMGIWTQARYRRDLVRRYGGYGALGAMFDGRATPTFVTAFLLLTAGLGALGMMLFRRFL